MKEKRIMTAKEWLFTFAATVLLLGVAVVAFNFVTDPFGAFGDRFFQWWSYNETMNPRVAKISYLEEHHQEYDSYIIGCSSTSSYPTEQLNEYFDANFYNLIMYGVDLHDVELTSRYLLEHYDVKNLVVNLYIQNAAVYNSEAHRLTYNLHRKVDGTSALSFYGRYLLCNPRYGMTKLQKYLSDGYLQQSHDVFNEATGAYDKSLRDVENIGDLESYLSKDRYAGFLNYPQETGSIPRLSECMASVRAIKTMCDEAGVNVVFVCPPLYYENFNFYSVEDVASFSRALAAETDYWDFTMSSVSFEPRYFYDETHFRNCVGEMALARMFDDTSIYVPEDFGFHVTAENVDELLETYAQAAAAEEITYTTRVPILMYHHLSEEEGTGDTISASRFEQHMAALRAAGYTAVSFPDLKAYVEQGTELPENPILITFDDGYESNLTLAAPILAKHNMEATVFTIGISAGKDTYKDTGAAMLPHFALEDAAAHEVLSIESHGYDIHEVEGRDPEPIRRGVLPREKESEEDYIAFLRADCAAESELFQSAYGRNPSVLAYPYGLHSELSELILSEEEFYATVTTTAHTNTIIKGMKQSLRAMGRYTVTGEMTAEEMLAMLEAE